MTLVTLELNNVARGLVSVIRGGYNEFAKKRPKITFKIE